MIRVAGEAFTELGVLCCNAYGAGVQMAFAHHDTAFDDEGGGGQAPFLGTEKCGDGDVAACLHLSVGLKNDAATKLILYECLVRFGKPEFPGQTCVADGAKRGGARAAVVTGDED